MKTLELFLSGALVLIGVSLVLKDAKQTSTVVKSLGGSTSQVFKTLQARD